jgi:hypothetical protein
VNAGTKGGQREDRDHNSFYNSVSKLSVHVLDIDAASDESFRGFGDNAISTMFGNHEV